VAPGGHVTLNVTIKGGLPPYSYRYTSLPAGCTSQNKPEFTCTPTATGTFKIETLVTDGAQVTALKTTNLSVQNPSSSTSFSLTSPIGIGVIVAVLVVAGVAGVIVLRRRRRSPPDRNEELPVE
ncbi:MAG: hypothetical protein L3J93_06165, partial [Thermoplasmata archaeon]|nr:hypothetical protein [Thermoplasmata archaeon]